MTGDKEWFLLRIDLSLVTCKLSLCCKRYRQQQHFHQRGDDGGGIKAVENTAVAGQKTAIVLDLGLSFDDGEGQIAQNVMEVDGYDDVFETFDGTVTFDNICQLKNDIATNFLGHDGTEVGIYGGVMPYRTRPNYMIIKNCNVAGQTDENKKLSVEIELLNAGE